MAAISGLESILQVYGFSPASRVRALAGGLINQTFSVEEHDRRAVLQRLHPVFQASVHFDIEAVTAHLEQKGLLTPRLLRTTNGALWTVAQDGGVWRMQSWLEGRTIHKLERAETARSAGRLVARFHEAVSDLRYAFRFVRPGVHDTPAHLAHLRRALAERGQHRDYEAIAPVAAQILARGERLEAMPELPARVVHGDLKISNVLFDDACEEARALVDLDTIANLTIPVELGDAFRSWCNPAGEDERDVVFRADLFEAALAGYAPGVRALLVPEERAALVLATETIALELAARFCADALYESYFGWNADKFPSRSAHNLARARSQLALAQSVGAQRAALEAIVVRAFAAGA